MKNKQTNHPAREERVRILDDAVSGISNRFITEVEEYRAEKTSGGRRASRTHTAPAWLRPVAACLAVLILGGLVVFSIPVVNNILTRRAPAELPGTDPVAEADTKEEETEKKEETEKPVETEEIEVSQFDKKYTVSVFTNPYYQKTTASFNDIMNDENRRGVGFASDAETLNINMTLEEMIEIMGCPPIKKYAPDLYEWALDDGRIVQVVRKHYVAEERYKYVGTWDYENNKVRWVTDEEELKEISAKYDELSEIIANAPFIRLEILDESWETVVKIAIKETTGHIVSQGLKPIWGIKDPVSVDEDGNEYPLP